MTTQKFTNDAIALMPTNAATHDLHGSAQGEDRLEGSNIRAETEGERSTQLARPSARGKTKAGKAGKRMKHKNKTLAKPRAPKTKVSGRKGGSKSDAIIMLLKRSQGATIPELIKATGWQAHSVRGFLSATVKRRMGLSLGSERAEGKDRRYRIA